MKEKKKLNCIVRFLQPFKGENDDSFHLLIQTNRECERLWKFYFIFAMGGFFTCLPIMSIASTFLCIWRKGEFDSKFVYHANRFMWVSQWWINDFSLKLICHILNEKSDFTNWFYCIDSSLPWNQETPLGYFGEICISMVCIEAYLIDNGALLLLFISMCLHHRTFFIMFENTLKKLNHLKQKHHQKQLICNLIRFHISVKQ